MRKIDPPATKLDAALHLPRERGAAHERGYLDHLHGQGLIIDIPRKVACVDGSRTAFGDFCY